MKLEDSISSARDSVIQCDFPGEDEEHRLYLLSTIYVHDFMNFYNGPMK